MHALVFNTEVSSKDYFNLQDLDEFDYYTLNFRPVNYNALGSAYVSCLICQTNVQPDRLLVL